METIFTEHEAAERLKVTVNTLATMRRKGKAPHAIIGRKPLYSESDLKKIYELCRIPAKESDSLQTKNIGSANGQDQAIGIELGSITEAVKRSEQALALQILNQRTKS